MTELPNRVALAGYAGVGKDEAAKALIDMGYERHNFGDIIKAQLNDFISKAKGFSAFTEDRDQKAGIRRTLEAWGEDNYDAILAEFLADLPEKCVNTRLVRVREAREWKKVGGVIVLVLRPGSSPATQWEDDRLEELCQSGLIDFTVWNRGTPAQLQAALLNVLASCGKAVPA